MAHLDKSLVAAQAFLIILCFMWLTQNCSNQSRRETVRILYNLYNYKETGNVRPTFIKLASDFNLDIYHLASYFWL